MALYRGYKTEAADLAYETRKELGLIGISALDPLALAVHLCITVLPLSGMSEIPVVREYFSEARQTEFCALTVFDGARRLVVHNDAHTPGRQASDITHELSHGLLMHEPRAALIAGCRDWDPDAEEEANWLAGVLLVTDDAAVAMARGGHSLSDGAKRYGVSEQLMQWRLNMSGAQRRVARAAHRARIG